MTHLTVSDMSPLTHRLYTRETTLVKSTSGRTLGERITLTLLGRVMFLCVSLLTHAEAVCRAVYLSFLALKSLFLRVNPRQMDMQKEKLLAAYQVSLLSLAACFYAKVLLKLPSSPPQQTTPTPKPPVTTQPLAQEPAGDPVDLNHQPEGVAEPAPRAATPLVEPGVADPSDAGSFELLSQPESPSQSPILAPRLEAPAPRRVPLMDDVVAALPPGESPQLPLLRPSSLEVAHFFNTPEEWQTELARVRGNARALIHEGRKGFDLQPDSPAGNYYSPDWKSFSPIVGFPVGICHSSDNGPRTTHPVGIGFNLTICSQEVPVHVFGFFETAGSGEASHFLTTQIGAILSAHLEKHAGRLTDLDVANIIKSVFLELGGKFKEAYGDSEADATVAVVIGNYLFTANLSGGGIVLMQDNSLFPLALERSSHDLQHRSVEINCQPLKNGDLLFIALPGFLSKCSLIELGEIFAQNGVEALKDLAYQLAHSAWAFKRTVQLPIQRPIGICLVHIAKAGPRVVHVTGDRAEYDFLSPLTTPRDDKQTEPPAPPLDTSLDHFAIPEADDEKEVERTPAPPQPIGHDGAAFASPVPDLAAFITQRWFDPEQGSSSDQPPRAHSDGVLVLHAPHRRAGTPPSAPPLRTVDEEASSSGDSMPDAEEARRSAPAVAEPGSNGPGGNPLRRSTSWWG